MKSPRLVTGAWAWALTFSQVDETTQHSFWQPSSLASAWRGKSQTYPSSSYLPAPKWESLQRQGSLASRDVQCGRSRSSSRCRQRQRTWRCFPVLQLRSALVLRELNQIFIACLFKRSQEQSFFLQTLSFTAFLVTVLKILAYALVSTWSSVSSGWEHVKRKMHPWQWCTINVALGRCLVSQTCSILVFSPPIMIRNW